MFFLLPIVYEVEIELPWDRTEDVERHGPVAAPLRIESDGLVVKLTAWDSSETVKIQAIANFLSGAVEHFKGIRNSENGLYERAVLRKSKESTEVVFFDAVGIDVRGRPDGGAMDGCSDMHM